MPSLFKVAGPRQNNQTKFSHAKFHFFKTVANSTKLHNVFALSLKQPQKAPFLLPLYVCMTLKNYGIFNSKFRRHVLPLVKYYWGVTWDNQQESNGLILTFWKISPRGRSDSKNVKCNGTLLYIVEGLNCTTLFLDCVSSSLKKWDPSFRGIYGYLLFQIVRSTSMIFF